MRGQKLAANVDFKELAGKTDKYSGRNLLEVCKAAVQYALYDSDKSGSDGSQGIEHSEITITMGHFDRAILAVPPTKSE
jgi:SpoVK/Ycf46/Vps4 family AAA+-type ATPase